jgi:hypothetical protein
MQPNRNFAAIVANLRTLPSRGNKLCGPFGAQQKPASLVMKMVPPRHWL